MHEYCCRMLLAEEAPPSGGPPDEDWPACLANGLDSLIDGEVAIPILQTFDRKFFTQYSEHRFPA